MSVRRCITGAIVFIAVWVLTFFLASWVLVEVAESFDVRNWNWLGVMDRGTLTFHRGSTLVLGLFALVAACAAARTFWRNSTKPKGDAARR